MPEQWNSYNSWMAGDNYLDWDGTEAGQGTFNGYEALGTAAAITSNDPSDKFYFELNDCFSTIIRLTAADTTIDITTSAN